MFSFLSQVHGNADRLLDGHHDAGAPLTKVRVAEGHLPPTDGRLKITNRRLADGLIVDPNLRPWSGIDVD